MDTLGASPEILLQYQVLTKSDIVASTAVADPNAPGQRNKALSWIWRMKESGATDPKWLDECMLTAGYPNVSCFTIADIPVVYRVNWLRAKSRRDRWEEELQLVGSELLWTSLYFRKRSAEWINRATSVVEDRPLLSYYALKQSHNWGLLEQQAERALNKLIPVASASFPGRSA